MAFLNNSNFRPILNISTTKPFSIKDWEREPYRVYPETDQLSKSILRSPCQGVGG
jgi:hypothetical protein